MLKANEKSSRSNQYHKLGRNYLIIIPALLQNVSHPNKILTNTDCQSVEHTMAQSGIEAYRNGQFRDALSRQPTDSMARKHNAIRQSGYLNHLHDRD